jgi:hypothetical protein
MRKLTFETDCVHSTYEDITETVDKAREITYRTFLRHVSFSDLCDLFPFYDRYPNQGGLMLKNDWAVSYHRSTYQGRRCYYIRHSMIEYIFI